MPRLVLLFYSQYNNDIGSALTVSFHYYKLHSDVKLITLLFKYPSQYQRESIYAGYIDIYNESALYQTMVQEHKNSLHHTVW